VTNETTRATTPTIEQLASALSADDEDDEEEDDERT